MRCQKCLSLIDCPFGIQGRACSEENCCLINRTSFSFVASQKFGQCGYVLLTCCRALRFVLRRTGERRTGELMVRRMDRLLHLTVDSLVPFCIHSCFMPCAWEVIIHRYSPHVRIMCIINVDHHLNHVCNKARRVLGFLYRGLFSHHMKLSHALLLYKSFVLPYLEYACQFWSPHNIADIKNLEGVQYFALKVITKHWTASYEELLSFTNLSILEMRRHF